MAEHKEKCSWNVLVDHKAILRSTLECQFGLIDELDSRFVLSDEELVDVTTIGRNHGMFQQNDELLRIMIVQRDLEKHGEFLSALNATNQEHVANYISNDGDDILCKDERPLREKERNRIRANQTFLLDHLCLDDLIDALYAVKCINEKHMVGIKKHSTLHDQIRELLDILKRRSFAQYKQFVDCVRETNQEHVADVLQSNGVIAIVNATLEVPSEQSVTDVEENIIRQFQLIPTKEGKTQLIHKLLGLSDVDVVAIAKNHSIRFYFLCATLEALRAIRSLYESGQLKTKIEDLFSNLLTEISIVPVRVRHIDLVDYWKSSDSFDNVYDSKEVSQEKSQALITRLPIELFEKILLKSFALNHMKLCKEALAVKKLVYNMMSSVCATWRSIATEQSQFKKMLKRNINFLDYEAYRCSLKKNRSVIIYSLECEYGLLSSLVRRKLLSEEKAENISEDHCLQSMPGSQGCKLKKLLEIIDGFQDRKQRAELFLALKETKQDHIATCLSPCDREDRVNENIPLTEAEQETIGCLYSFLIRQIKLIILPSLLSTGFLNEEHVAAISNEKTENEKKEKLLDILVHQSVAQYKQFVRCLHDTDQHHVAQRMKSYQALHVKGVRKLKTKRKVWGVAHLDGCIYVLREQSCRINVFDDQTFERQDDVILKMDRISSTHGFDMAASSRRHCLYISDFENRYILKLVVDGRTVTKWLARQAWGVSVTSPDQVLLVNNSPASLFIYNPDATLDFSIKLLSSINDPRHAVETSTGNFIISHGEPAFQYITEVSRNGNFIRSYSESHNGSYSLPHFARHITIDAENNVYVADTYNDHVLILNSSLVLRRVIPTSNYHGNRGEPQRVCYSRETKKLTVGLMTGRIIIYTVTS